LWSFEGIAPGETVDHGVFRLPELGGALSVSVFDARGNPINRAVLRAGAESDVAGLGPPQRMTTDPKGEARADDLATGPTQLQVRAASYGCWHGLIAVTPGTTTRLRVVLPDSALVRGRVEDPAGQPVAGAIVRAFAKGKFLS